MDDPTFKLRGEAPAAGRLAEREWQVQFSELVQPIMNAPLSQLEVADIDFPGLDGGTLLKIAHGSIAELQKRAASSGHGDFLHLKTAAAITGRSRETIRRWFHDDPLLGKRTPGGLVVSASRLMERCARP
jgi:hypothetical protein